MRDCRTCPIQVSDSPTHGKECTPCVEGEGKRWGFFFCKWKEVTLILRASRLFVAFVTKKGAIKLTQASFPFDEKGVRQADERAEAAAEQLQLRYTIGYRKEK